MHQKSADAGQINGYLIITVTLFGFVKFFQISFVAIGDFESIKQYRIGLTHLKATVTSQLQTSAKNQKLYAKPRKRILQGRTNIQV